MALSGREMCVVEGDSHGLRGSELEREMCVVEGDSHGLRGSELEREMCVVKGGSRGSELERGVCGGGWLTWLKWL